MSTEQSGVPQDVIDALDAYASVSTCPGISLGDGNVSGCSCGGCTDPGCDCPTCATIGRLFGPVAG